MAATVIVLAGGGTGGHVYPALSIGDVLAGRGHRILYYGDPARLEGRVVEKRGYPLRAVRALAYPRGGLVGKVRFALALAVATWRASRQLRRDGAGLVLGVGGYISAPTVLGAWLAGIPRVIHEANVSPGLANKLCARVADRILLTFAQTAARLPGRAPREVVGCPVNPKVLEGESAAARTAYGLDLDRPVLLVVGGSLGAATLNRLGVEAARDPARDYQVLHITGPTYHAEVRQALDPLPGGVVLVDYEHAMGRAYAAADLVVCRAGSSTLAELTVLGKPSVLIPSPNVTENHQEQNALGLEQVGAALMFVERDLEVRVVLDRVARLLRDRQALAVMAQAAHNLGRPDTAARVADTLESLLG
jgi:UDP-N-acetylglucosamine--N-acetylmuramyl-(pentapeptide) pyrophosphoryl-undecaprenol N-acetylglucosamine transferase